MLTKHCKAQDRDRMLAGHFKFGTHAEYAVPQATGLLSDSGEGVGRVDVVGSIIDASWDDARGNSFKNITIIGPGTSIRIDAGINASLFCSSGGVHDIQRHSHILNGIGDYTPNPEVVAYIEIDEIKIIEATKLLAEEAYPLGHAVLYGLVKYGNRDISHTAENLISVIAGNAIPIRSIEVAFTKPPRYEVEQEYRIAILPKHEPAKSLLTNNFSGRVTKAFRDAIANIGAASIN